MQNRADQRKYHYIYKITRFDGLFYIGLHSTDDLDDGYFGSGTRLTNSIRYHGIEKHTKEILEFLPTRKMLKEREAEILTEDLRADPLCMNIAPGGSGGWCGNANSLKPLRDPVVRARGNVRATMTIRSRRQDPLYNEKFLQKQRKAAASSKRFTGKQHSEETKQKMRKPKNLGSANSQFGTCWVTNGTPLKIKQEQLEEYLVKGYRRGRK